MTKDLKGMVKHLITGLPWWHSGYRASLVAQWLRIHLPMQGTRVRTLVREDPTFRRATKAVRHSY